MNKEILTGTLQRIIVVMIPIGVFAALYFFLGKWPNYQFNEIDIGGVYTMEKKLFGMVLADGMVVTPCEYFHQNHFWLMDILSGLFYLCWVPLPVIYALYLLFRGHGQEAIRLTSAFLLVNIIGFAGYYIYPAAPPWYAIEYGFTPIPGTPGNVAGFERFDEIVGMPLFHGIYARNANVFAAIPSLHVAYNPVALFYAFKVKSDYLWQSVLAIVSAGICFSAVYSCHHYIIDVTLGLLTAILGITLFECLLLRIPVIRVAYERIGAWLGEIQLYNN
ncbi:MAG: phosphatase PAP2 family protein [Bacteroidaceae bacterium]